jgi:hypothetical protein
MRLPSAWPIAWPPPLGSNQQEKQTMTVISFHISRWLGTTRAATNEIRPAGVDLARPRLFALLIGGAVVCTSLAMTASVNSADARPGYGGGHGGHGHGYGGHGYGGHWGGHGYGGHGYGYGAKPYWGHGHGRYYGHYYWGPRYAAYGLARSRCKDLPPQQLGNVVCSGSVPLKPLPAR